MKQISLLFTNSYVITYQSLVKTNGLNEKSSKNSMKRVNKKLNKKSIICVSNTNSCWNKVVQCWNNYQCNVISFF